MTLWAASMLFPDWSCFTALYIISVFYCIFSLDILQKGPNIATVIFTTSTMHTFLYLFAAFQLVLIFIICSIGQLSEIGSLLRFVPSQLYICFFIDQYHQLSTTVSHSWHLGIDILKTETESAKVKLEMLNSLYTQFLALPLVLTNTSRSLNVSCSLELIIRGSL